MTPEKIYSVFELNDAVRGLIRSEFSGYVWVCGEIQDLRERGHINLSLVQKHPEFDQIIAQVKAVIFENVKPRVLSRIKDSGSDFELKKDIEVKLLCKVDLYVKTGQFSLTVFDIDPVYTLGKIASNRQKIINELQSRGVFDKNKTKELPLLPLKIGVITAYESAAYYDFVNELKSSGYGFKLLTRDCYMQGKLVERDICRALGYFDNFSQDNLDCIVITRGGGSTADLSFFDNKKIAQAIADCSFPVISALGHEINVTIADMAAHTSLKTPTAAAKFFVERISGFVQRLDYVRDEIFRRAGDFLSDTKKQLESSTVKIENSIVKYFSRHKEELLEKKHRAQQVISLYLVREKSQLQRFSKNLETNAAKFVKDKKQNINHIEEKIKLLNPREILKRGYSITFKGKKAVKSIDDIEDKDFIKTIFYKGSIISQVKNVFRISKNKKNTKFETN